MMNKALNISDINLHVYLNSTEKQIWLKKNVQTSGLKWCVIKIDCQCIIPVRISLYSTSLNKKKII